MKVTFKDLKQQKFTVEFEPTDLVAAVKEKLSTEKGWEPKDQKLIYSGKILKDDQTIGSYNIDEKAFVVCMVTKPKAPKPAVQAAAEPATPAQATPGTSAQVAPPAPSAPTSSSSLAQAAPSTPTPQRTATPSQTSATAGFNDPSSLLIGNQRAEVIANMEAMGFERSQIDSAMRAAFFNPDRAVEYLLSGIPEHVQQEQARQASAAPNAPSVPSAPSAPNVAAAATATPAAPATQPANAGVGATGQDEDNVNLFDLAARQRGAGAHTAGAAATGGAAFAGGMGDLEFLRANPQFQQLRQIVQQQPQMLETILQQLGAGNPQVAEAISQNPEQFLELLSEDADDDAPLPPGVQAISVTEDERDAIERLCRLGFDREQAIQAYFACDKNEEMAANFLFDQPDEDDQPQN